MTLPYHERSVTCICPLVLSNAVILLFPCLPCLLSIPSLSLCLMSNCHGSSYPPLLRKNMSCLRRFRVKVSYIVLRLLFLLVSHQIITSLLLGGIRAFLPCVTRTSLEFSFRLISYVLVFQCHLPVPCIIPWVNLAIPIYFIEY